MDTQRRTAIYEDLKEAETFAELDVLWNQMQDDAPECACDEDVMREYDVAVERLKQNPVVDIEPIENRPEELTLVQKIAELQKQLNEMTSAVKPKTAKSSKNKYKLLSADVSWSTKPQVHALMGILTAHAEPGTVLEEDHIVEMMVKNEAVLQTRQGGRKIWNYYKGDHMEGLMAHGNIERA